MRRWVVEPPADGPGAETLARLASELDRLLPWYQDLGHRVEPGVIRLRPSRRQRGGFDVQLVFALASAPDVRLGFDYGPGPPKPSNADEWLELLPINLLEAVATRKRASRHTNDEGIAWL